MPTVLERTVVEIVTDGSKFLAAIESLARDTRALLGKAFQNATKDVNSFLSSMEKSVEGFKNLGGEGGRLASALDGVVGGIKNTLSGFTALGPAGAAVALSLAAITAGVAAAVAAIAAVGVGIYKLTTQAADAGDEMFTLSNKTGIAVEALSELKFVGQQADVPLETMTTAIFKLGQTLAEGGDKAKSALGTIGLSFEQVRKLSPDKAFELVISRLHEIPDAGKRAAAGVALFGKGFREIAQLTEEDMKGLIDQAHDLGLVMSTEMAVAGDRFNDAIGAIGAQIDALQTRIGAAFLPVAITFVETFGEQFTKALTAAGMKAGEFSDVLEKVAVFIGGTLLPGLIIGFSEAAKAVVTFFAGQGITATFIVDALASVVDAVERVVNALSYVSPGMQPALDALRQLSKTGHEAAANTAKDIGSVAGPIFKTLDAVEDAAKVTAFTFPAALAKVKAEITATADAMRKAKSGMDGFGGGLDEVSGKAAKAADKLNELQDKELQILAQMNIWTQASVSTALEPFIDQLNKASQVSDQQFLASLQKLLPQLIALRDRVREAGGPFQILNELIDQAGQKAGLTADALQRMELAIPIWQGTTGAIQQYDVAAEQAAAQTGALEQAFKTLGLTSQAELDKTAEEAKKAWQVIVQQFGAGSVQAREAYQKMIDAVNAATRTVPTYWESEVWPKITGVLGNLQTALNDALLGMRSQSAQEHQKLADDAIANYDRIRESATQEFEQIKADGSKTPKEIAAAHLKMAKDIEAAHREMQAAIEKASHPFRDTIVDIFKDMGRGIMQVFSDILADFENRFLKGLLGAIAGQQGAFSKAFAGLFGGGGGGLMPGGPNVGGSWWQKLLGIPGLGGAGAVVPGAVGIEAGIPILGGAAGFGAPVAGGAAGTWAGTGGTAATGTAMTGVLGGVGAGAAGFGLGALMQKFFGRGTGSALAGGGSGALSGALIGSIVPGIGTAIGALIGGLGGVLGGLVNFGPSKKELAARAGVKSFQQDTFANLTETQRTEAQGAGWADPAAAGTLIAVRDAYLAVGKSAADAERDVKAMWDAEVKGPEATQAAMGPILAALDEFRKKNGDAAKSAETLEQSMAGVIAQMDPDEMQALAAGYKQALTEGFTGSLEDFARQQLEFYQTLEEGDERLKTFFMGHTMEAFAAVEKAGGAAAQKIADDFAKMGDELKDKLKGLDQELADLNRSEAPEAHMGTEEKKARDRIAKQKAEYEKQLQAIQEQSKKVLDAIGTTGAGAVDTIGAAIAALPEAMRPAAQKMVDAMKAAGIDMTGPQGLGMIEDFLKGLGPAAQAGVDKIEDAFGHAHIDPIRVPWKWEAAGGEEPPDGVTIPRIPGHAQGGLFDVPHIAHVAEHEPEVIGSIGFMAAALKGAMQSLGLESTRTIAGIGGGVGTLLGIPTDADREQQQRALQAKLDEAKRAYENLGPKERAETDALFKQLQDEVDKHKGDIIALGGAWESVASMGVGPDGLGKIAGFFPALVGQAKAAAAAIGSEFSGVLGGLFGSGGGSMLYPGGSATFDEGFGSANPSGPTTKFPSGGADMVTSRTEGDWTIYSGGIAGMTYRVNNNTGERQWFDKRTGKWVSGSPLQVAPSVPTFDALRLYPGGSSSFDETAGGAFRVPTVSIPGHAKGGLFDVPHIAAIAEKRPEIVGDEPFMKRAMAGALEAVGYKPQRPPVNITIQISATDGESVSRLVRSGGFKKELARQLPFLFSDNIEGVRTNSLRALGVSG